MSLIIRRYPDLTPAVPAYVGTPDEVMVRFSPKAWKHFIEHPDGKLEELWGVTGTLKIVSKEALVPWAVRVALERARKLLIERGLGPDSSVQL